LKVRSLHRAGLLTTAARELARYKLDLEGVQGVRWDRGSRVRAGDCNFLYGKEKENHQSYLSIRRAIKQTVVIIDAYHFCQLCTKFIQRPAVKFNSICGGNYWGSSMWISKQQTNC